MPAPRPDRKKDQLLPTAAELDILAALWRLGPATVREVHESLNKESGYTTTLKQMQIMTDKGLIARSERFRAYVYQASIPKEQTQTQIVGDLMSRAFEGSARGLVLGALAAKPATPAELREIRRMIDEWGKAK
jgi:BlaI family penicillinase repressor